MKYVLFPQLLSKQLEVLRNVNESRMRVYEDVDKNLQDLEKTNERLKQDSKTDKDKIKLYVMSLHTQVQIKYICIQFCNCLIWSFDGQTISTFSGMNSV